MRIPKFCGLAEFKRSLDHNSLKIAIVSDSFNAGCFDEAALNDLIMAARRTALVCNELIKRHNLEMSLEVAAKEEDPDLQGMHWG